MYRFPFADIARDMHSIYRYRCIYSRGFPGGSVGKNPPANAGMQVPSLGQEDPWRRKWQPIPVFLPGKSHVQRSLAGYSPWGCKRIGHDLGNKQLYTHIMVYHLFGYSIQLSKLLLWKTENDLNSYIRHTRKWKQWNHWKKKNHINNNSKINRRIRHKHQNEIQCS